MSRASSAPAAKRAPSANSGKAGAPDKANKADIAGKATKLVKAGSKKKSSAQAVPVVEKDSWLQRLKRFRFSFKRKGFNIQVLLEDPAKHIAEIKRESAAAEISEAATLNAALKGVLDRHPTSRSVLVHLGLLEKAMSRHGLKALDDMPADILQRAMSQFDTLVSDWSPAPLAALRAKIKTVLLAHERANDHRSTAQRLSDFHDDKRMHVAEASVTTFMEANAEWEKSFTGQRLSAAVK